MKSFKFWLATIVFVNIIFLTGMYFIYIPVNDSEMYFIIEILLLSILLNIGMELKMSNQSKNKWLKVKNIAIQLCITLVLSYCTYQFLLMINSALTTQLLKVQAATKSSLRISVIFQFAYMFSNLIFNKKLENK